MSFDDKPVEVLVKLAHAGLGFTLNTDKVDPEVVLDVTNAAALSGAQITLIDNESEKTAWCHSAVIKTTYSKI